MPSLRQEEKFFDSRGNVRTITLAPAIHKIEPLEGSGEGGTRITITGRGFSRFGDETEVLIGGDPCEIKELSSLISPNNLHDDQAILYLEHKLSD